MSAEKTIIPVDMNNDYLRAVIKSFHQFIIEETVGQINADCRLEKRLEAARTLYPEERRALANGTKYYGRWDESNVELTFGTKG